MVDDSEVLALRKDIHDAILQSWNSKQRIYIRNRRPKSKGGSMYDVQVLPDNYNVIISSEEFDRFGTTPWSKRDGIHAIKEVVNLVRPPRLDLVVSYRTPRHEHWISIYKQLAAMEALEEKKQYETNSNETRTTDVHENAKDYKSFICNDERTWEYLDSVANPLGLARTLLWENRWNVTLLDMAGIQAEGRDITHTVACDILGVPCHESNHTVKGIDHNVVINVRSQQKSPELPNRDELEWILRARDCSYAAQIAPSAKELGSMGHLSILYQNELWKDCPLLSTESKSLTPDQYSHLQRFYAQFQDTSLLLQLIQAQMKCPGVRAPPSIDISSWMYHDFSSGETPNFDSAAFSALTVLQYMIVASLIVLLRSLKRRRLKAKYSV